MRHPRRASVIVAVLLLLAIGVVIAASVLVSADAAAAVARAEMERTQSRALAWSGVQAVMDELAGQRDAVIEGARPDVTPEWSLFTLDDGTRGVVRLIDLSEDDPGLLEPESSKLDINHATAEMLALAPGLDETLAARIVAARAEQPFASVEQLLGIEGITPELLYGRAASEEEPLLSVSPSPAPGVGPPPPADGLIRLLTVFSFDPNVQTGLDGDTDASGNLRVNLDQEWSVRLRSAIADRLGDAAAELVRSLIESGRSFATDADLVQALIDSGVEPEEWGEILDIFTTSGDEFLLGRVDVNSAPAEVLGCIPGISPAKAAQIVEARASIDETSRRAPCWPVVEEILTPEEFLQAADHLTARTAQWRVRLEVGIERGGEEGLAPVGQSMPMTMDELRESWDEPVNAPALEQRMSFEAVIDIASTRPRVAYLRDVTVLEPVMAMLAAAREEEDAAPEPPSETPEPSPGVPALGSPDDLGGESVEDDPFLAGDADLDLRFGADEQGDDTPEDDVILDDEAPAPTDAGAEEERSTDPRIGRWTTRRAAKS